MYVIKYIVYGFTLSPWQLNDICSLILTFKVVYSCSKYFEVLLPWLSFQLPTSNKKRWQQTKSTFQLYKRCWGICIFKLEKKLLHYSTHLFQFYQKQIDVYSMLTVRCMHELPTIYNGKRKVIYTRLTIYILFGDVLCTNCLW